MSVYFVTGKLGNGKTLVAVGKIQEYLQAGKRVATNLDINLDKMLGKWARNVDLTRLPDKPRLEDMEALGTGDGLSIDEYSEKGFGLIVLDELGTWFNSRTWKDKGRQELINWMLHARKLHWDLILIVQDVEAVDKQLRDMLCENLVICRRLDNIRIPIIGPLGKMLTGGIWTPKLPRIHRAKVHAGQTKSDWVADVWTYTGNDLFRAYYTGQCFAYDEMFHNGEPVDMRASFTVLPPWYTHGRYEPRATLRDILKKIFYLIFAVLALAAFKLVGGVPRSGSAPTRRNNVRVRPAIINGNLETTERRYLTRKMPGEVMPNG